VTFVQSPGE